MNNQQQKSIRDKVLNKIETGDVKMKPKIYFILRTVLLITGTVVIFLFILYLISFIVFFMRISGVWFLPEFGFPGIRIFLYSLPWLLILISLILFVTLEIFAKRFTFVYRRPIIYSILIIITFVLLGSFVIGKTRLHPNLFWQAQEGRLPIAGKMYRDFKMTKFQNVHRGIVSEITNDGFRIEKPDGQVLTVILSPDTKFPFKKEIKEGDIMVVMGKQDNDIVRAYGVRKTDNDSNIFLKHRIRMPLR